MGPEYTCIEKRGLCHSNPYTLTWIRAVCWWSFIDGQRQRPSRPGQLLEGPRARVVPPIFYDGGIDGEMGRDVMSFIFVLILISVRTSKTFTHLGTRVFLDFFIAGGSRIMTV